VIAQAGSGAFVDDDLDDYDAVGDDDDLSHVDGVSPAGERVPTPLALSAPPLRNRQRKGHVRGKVSRAPSQLDSIAARPAPPLPPLAEYLALLWAC
jgi:hypothetical protein